MSTAELIQEPETTTASVFDGPHAITWLGSESSGLIMTKEEFLAIEEFDDLYHYELIRGVVVASPLAPAADRAVNGQLSHWLLTYRDRHQLGSPLDATIYGQEVETGESIRLTDRVIWAGLGREPNTDTDVPTIVIELVSKGRRDLRRDYEEKRKEYAAIGVKEYWVFDRFRRTLTVCRGEEVTRIVKESETYETPLLPGFQLPVGKLLAVADRWSKEHQ